MPYHTFKLIMLVLPLENSSVYERKRNLDFQINSKLLLLKQLYAFNQDSSFSTFFLNIFNSGREYKSDRLPLLDQPSFQFDCKL